MNYDYKRHNLRKNGEKWTDYRTQQEDTTITTGH